ncbi:BAHD family acyltransferase, clade I [Selaginella moellendorffii]|uniref:BAHD family acyltransferase, clade I n=1 Tax=Selaginella moellendorffii TaxID=88036 RepID=D8R1J9_SELML|nr:rosmarinate synthase [Selaginella moellendorffii]EFJ33902.1 BAHD family acyltransferase, clade I [Selaginella moellendorffii]|eukprot:XP_002965064.1 rosmarinate synthase [Selaginella moellendorffii]
MVSIVSSEMIQPAAAIPPARFELTAFDRIMRYVPYQKRVLFFAAPPGVEDDLFARVMGDLKRSLAEALVVFYPLAGRMRSTGETLEGLELDCTSDRGVKLSVAEASMRLGDLAPDFEPSKFCDSLSEIGSPEPAHPWKPEDPLLFVQVTRFQCGGLSIGVAFSHQAMDGISAWRFIACWAKLARSGLDQGSLSPKEIPGPFYSYNEETPAMDRDELLAAGAAGGFLPLESAKSMPPLPLGTKIFKLDRAAIESLKIEAGISASDGKRFTTYEVVCANFWKRMTIARALPSGSASNFIILASGRGKMESVPESYFGNAVIYSLVSAAAEELDREPLSHAAELIHRAIAAGDEQRAKKITAFMDREIARLVTRYRIYPFHIVVSSPRHPVMECDFGFGRPLGSSFGTNDLHEGKIYLFPSAEMDGGMSVTVVLQPDAIQRLT